MNYSRLNKSTLITGGAGYIGSNLALELLKKKNRVIIVDNFINSKRSNLKYLEKKFKNLLQIKKVDICNKNKIAEIFKKNNIEIVYHLAALKSVSESVKKKNIYFKNNFLATSNLLKQMKYYNVNRLIFSSSATVYGNQKKYPFTENKIGKPTNPYGYTKIKCENLIKSYSQKKNSFLKSIILRYFNPLGADIKYRLGDRPRKPEDTLMNNIGKSIKEDRIFYIYGKNHNTKDGTCVRDFIHIKDIINGHISAKKLLDKKNFSIINLGSGRYRTVLQVLRQFEKTSKRKIDYEFKPKRLGDISVSIADITKAKRLIKWKPKYSLKSMCESHWKLINS